MTRISHSGKETFLQCGEKYRLHYQEKLRSGIYPSPFLLGKSWDEALNCLLLSKKNPDNYTEEDKKLLQFDAHMILDNELLNQVHNGQSIYVPTFQFIKYYSKDYDSSLLDAEDLLFINSTAQRLEYEPFDKEVCDEFVQSCKNEIRSSKALGKDAQVLFNLIHWCCVRRKLHYLLDRYEEDVLPLLEEVFSVQKKVELSAGEHNLIGYIDFIASFKDEPGVKYVIDNKLASKAYPKDAIDDAVQLATYCEHEGIKKASFIITEKGLRKRDPKHRIQILRGEITEELFERTFDEFGEVVYNIGQGVFEKTGMDGSRQECFHFGQRCQFYNTCRGEPDKDFLVRLD
ncbi:hypothetical protein N9K75_02120 [bacterium]|nr:hypothetical protein [bacterium]